MHRLAFFIAFGHTFEYNSFCCGEKLAHCTVSLALLLIRMPIISFAAPRWAQHYRRRGVKDIHMILVLGDTTQEAGFLQKLSKQLG